MRIKNAEIFQPDGSFIRKDLLIRGEKLTETKNPPLENVGQDSSEEILDASGLLAIPMLVDIHFHGCAGVDFCDGNLESIRKMAEYELNSGIGAICPATMTLSESRLGEIVRTAADYRHKQQTTQPAADLVGIHLEGPFLSREKKGAQNETFLRAPNADLFRILQEQAEGLIKICDIAPEEPGAEDCIQALAKGKETVLSIAHTCADYETARKAFALGVSHMTHLYNAMPAISHRAPGPVVAAWEAGAETELIADGVHIHPAVVRMTFSLFGDDRVILISDSMMATGLPDGAYELGGQAVTVRGNRAVLTKNPEVIAGSVTNLMDCLRKAVLEMGIPLGSAVKAAALNPAKCIGIDADYGSLEPGHYANVLFVDKKLRIQHAIFKGKVL